MTTLTITVEHKHRHRLQPGSLRNAQLNLNNLCQALEWDEDAEEDGVISLFNLSGDQTFLERQQVVLQLVKVSGERTAEV